MLRILALSLLLSLSSQPSYAIVDSLAGFLVSDEEVYQLGEQSFEEIKKQERISQDEAAQRRVREIGRRIVEVANTDIPFEQWEFVVFDNDQINAFALPGGNVGVYTGLMRVAENDDQLAAVIGHEIAHVTEDHTKERIATSIATTLGTDILAQGAAAIVGGDNPAVREIAGMIVGAGADITLAKPFGRSQESESDAVGLRYMADAGYDPHAAVAFWQNMMQAKGGGGPPAFLSTHPSDQARITALEQQIRQMGY